VIAVPASAVEDAVEDCIRAGVAGIVLITAGFGETGEEGRRRETALRDRVRRAGIRMIGPNCLGIVSTDPAVRLNASFAPSMPMAGPVAFASQSGALGLAILEATGRLGVGLSSFVSTGNAADVSFADLLEYWQADPRTKVILLYAESFAEPRQFAEVARRVSRIKPIVVLKSGRSPAGAKAASSHTGALAQQDALVDAMLRDAGVLRAESLEDLFATAALLGYQPLPRGPRVAVLTNAGGPGILAADACAAAGLTMAQPSPATVAALRAFLPANAGLGNPIDMIATASPDDYRRAVPLLLADPEVDSLVAMFIPLSVTNTSDVAAVVGGAARNSDKPVLATFFGATGVASLVAPAPCYQFPETSIRALAAAEAYGRHLSEPEAAPTSPRIERAAVRPIVERALAAGDRWMDFREAASLLETSGIAVVAQEVGGEWRRGRHSRPAPGISGRRQRSGAHPATQDGRSRRLPESRGRERRTGGIPRGRRAPGGRDGHRTGHDSQRRRNARRRRAAGRLRPCGDVRQRWHARGIAERRRLATGAADTGRCGQHVERRTGDAAASRIPRSRPAR
jgi:acyl-CoA synthetase (NDP forming)